MVIDESGVYLASGKPGVVLLTKSSRVNLDRLIADLRPTYIYADGSNYPSSIALWKKTCAQKNIPFQTTFEKGYVMIE